MQCSYRFNQYAPMDTIGIDSKLAIQFDFHELERISKWLNETGKILNLPDSLVGDLDLCTHEAVANIISYAEEHARHHPIEISLATENDSVILRIQDRGQAFNPLEMPPPEQAKNLKEAKVGGMGIHLIRSLMDECSYERQNESNVLVLKACLQMN